LPCFRHCQIFLLRGAFLVEEQGQVTETGCSYLIKDEVWIGLCGSTTIVVMEDREERGTCLEHRQESRKRLLAEMQSLKRLKKKLKFGRPKATLKCTLM
jgi:hypothetical protein